MTNNKQFDSKWQIAGNVGQTVEEFTIFVPKGHMPETQRQFNLFNYFEYIGKLAQKYNVKKALEVGCGRGTISLYLKQYLGVDVTLIDVSDEAVELAKKILIFIKRQA